MTPEYYASPSDYIRTGKTLVEMIQKIDEIVCAMLLSSIDGAPDANIEEYQVNTGQSIVKTIYRSPMEALNGLKALEALRNTYQAKITGRVTHLEHVNVNRR